MHNRENNESGQVFVLAALSLMALVGIVAFAINASYAFYQHTQMQAQLDAATRYAAGSSPSCPSTLATLPGATFGPVTNGPYKGKTNYCEGYYSKDTAGLFGDILKFPMNLSVHAVALGSVSQKKEVVPVVVAFDNVPGDCGIYSKDGGATLTINSTESVVVSDNSSECVGNNAVLTINGTNVTQDTVINSGMADNPFGPSPALPAYNATNYPNAITVCSKGCTYSQWTNAKNTGYLDSMTSGCVTKLNKEGITSSTSLSNGAAYYFPPSNTGLTNVVPDNNNTFGTSNTNYYLYDYCGGQAAGVYYFNETMSFGGSKQKSSLSTQDSTIVLGPAVSLSNGGGFSWYLDGPTQGRFYSAAYGGIAVWEDTSLPCTGSSPNTNTLGLFGNSGSYVNGVVDTVCDILQVTGNGSATDYKGAVIAWQMESSGSGTFNINPPIGGIYTYRYRGSFLVQ